MVANPFSCIGGRDLSRYEICMETICEMATEGPDRSEADRGDEDQAKAKANEGASYLGSPHLILRLSGKCWWQSKKVGVRHCGSEKRMR